MGNSDGAGRNESLGVNDDYDRDLLKEYAIGLISRHIQIKEQKRIEPCMAIMTEMSAGLMEDFKSVLNSLVREEVIEWHKNVNGILMFEFKRK